ncbi:MAG TPA: hypothetical protein VFT47_00540 [Vicinamibacterales bacterium]|nr:hypothetical protein [Vicinamibacterales bacterium]
MRIACATFVSWLMVTALPGTLSAQEVVTPFERPPNSEERLDRGVPVATVAPIGQPIALPAARRIETPPDTFMLGAATLDLSDPSRANLVFAMTNVSDAPIPKDTVVIEEYSVMLHPDVGFLFPSLGGLLEPRGRPARPWRPGETITVRIPISPVPKDGTLQAFLVLVQTADTARRAGGDERLLRRALETLLARVRP